MLMKMLLSTKIWICRNFRILENCGWCMIFWILFEIVCHVGLLWLWFSMLPLLIHLLIFWNVAENVAVHKNLNLPKFKDFGKLWLVHDILNAVSNSMLSKTTFAVNHYAPTVDWLVDFLKYPWKCWYLWKNEIFRNLRILENSGWCMIFWMLF